MCLKNKATGLLLPFLFFCLLQEAQAQGVYNKMPGDAGSQYMLIPDFRDTSYLMKYILRSYEMRNRYQDSAVKLLYEGLQQSRQQGFVHGEISALICLGNIFSGMGRY